MNSSTGNQTCHPTPPPATAATSHDDSPDRGDPRPAVSLRFQLGELSATPEALAAAHAAGIRVVEAVLRHLGGDWGLVDDQTRAANDHAVTAGGTLRSLYPVPGTTDALVVTTDAERGHTIAALASQSEPRW